ncbi:hypothetical protein Taro_020276 [Colocasia esculenta]|uniref:Thioredoxin domain-containing protein n=1 Tax=Colocasia esculenta TaxID=4460 RepID=A0A843V829_COLES|nr:hypothetical protein [Colocasia esculenta]
MCDPTHSQSPFPSSSPLQSSCHQTLLAHAVRGLERERRKSSIVFFSRRPMSEALRLPLNLPTTTPPLRRRRCKGRWASSSTASPGLHSSLTNSFPGRTFCSVPPRNRFVVVASTSSSWSVEEGGPPGEGNGTQQLLGGEEDAPTSIELETVSGEEHFDRIIVEAQKLEVPVVVVWMANWCRKCIYLKPKLEKLAANYYPRSNLPEPWPCWTKIRFYHVDVNAVPHKLVKRAGVTLWKDSTKQAEVIGGHKAWLVIDDIRRMIEDVP